MSDRNAKLRNFINEEILMGGEGTVNDDTPLVGGVLDSMALMRLIAFVEEEFEIEIDEGEVTASNFGTVNDVVRLIEATSARSAG